jgi:hypothetical protein
MTLPRSGAGDEVMMSISGHVSRAMLSATLACGWKRSGAHSTRLLRASAQPTRSEKTKADGNSRPGLRLNQQ